ncbi:sigma-54-dependent Fis family transcriptional regulator [Pelomonas sp. CA6]|uniref:sigma-54-dependent Fis family transcriptional regulator n=1 Tax=Pelomonas sp. CA6 TaxID=2907999 RepID=UPI001F4B38FC|nr:sigma-54-dependent Fis family transcriptional regulator [Pelomonas sp. CA6]MCH7342479.1 sigma-54-dependent Fis family transcriptional regulator [Pelomonas sp. CA6]
MQARPTTPRLAPERVREARRQWLEQGSLAPGLIPPELARSWDRSREHGLQPLGRMPGAPHASGPQLARALEERRALVSHARPVMAFLNEQIQHSDSLVILSDPQGMLLHALGDDGFADRAARVALRPGAIWSEQWRGTNAIGTALADGSPVVVHGAEHYLDRNAFLTCAAAPIVDPGGALLGALDISGDRRGYHRHTLGLVRSGARMIEHQLFEARHGAGLRLRLHAQREGLGTVTEGLLALSEDGWIIGANSVALALLGLSRTAIGATRAERVLGLGLEELLGGPLAALGTPRQLPLPQGGPLWMAVEPGRTLRHGVAAAALRTAPAPAPAPAVEAAARPAPVERDALAALDSGDAAMARAVGRARRVLGKPIALLLQGESGVGKDVFARALHAAGPRGDGPFVAVNCAAMPEGLIEAELFGYRGGAFTGAAREGAPGRIREAHGGTLFLDEIGDMPLSMQARLLRVLQERQVLPLGGGKPVAVDFALVCATHRQLRDEVAAGRFREDLYYRLNGLALQLPPLRERSDLALLVQRRLAELAPGRALALEPALMQAFAAYRWPGNLRQLDNVLRTACALLDEAESLIDWAHLPDDLCDELQALQGAGASAEREPPPAADLRRQALRSVEAALQDSGGNVSEAARRLGISRNTLYRKLRELRTTSHH